MPFSNRKRSSANTQINIKYNSFVLAWLNHKYIFSVRFTVKLPKVLRIMFMATWQTYPWQLFLLTGEGFSINLKITVLRTQRVFQCLLWQGRLSVQQRRGCLEHRESAWRWTRAQWPADSASFPGSPNYTAQKHVLGFRWEKMVSGMKKLKMPPSQECLCQSPFAKPCAVLPRQWRRVTKDLLPRVCSLMVTMTDIFGCQNLTLKKLTLVGELRIKHIEYFQASIYIRMSTSRLLRLSPRTMAVMGFFPALESCTAASVTSILPLLLCLWKLLGTAPEAAAPRVDPGPQTEIQCLF